MAIDLHKKENIKTTDRHTMINKENNRLPAYSSNTNSEF